MAKIPDEIEMMGHLEDDPTEAGRMIVRVLGKRLGTAAVWLHFGGWCIVAMDFKPEDKRFACDGEHKDVALLVDLYSGEMAMVAGASTVDNDTTNWVLLCKHQLVEKLPS